MSFFWKQTDFRPIFRFSAKPKNSRFSIIPAGTRSVVNVGHFLGGPYGPYYFIFLLFHDELKEQSREICYGATNPSELVGHTLGFP